MNGCQNDRFYAKAPVYSSRLMILVGISACLFLAFVLNACSGNPFPNADAAAAISASTTSTAGGYPVKVYFSKSPVSLNSNFQAVYPVARISPTTAVATFAIQLLIAGPTLPEQQAGYFTELNTLLSGPSNCASPLPVGGPDFKLTLDKRGSRTQIGTATLRFCRSLNSPGIGADARVTAEINATLKQFSRIKNVVILTKDGHCFGSGMGTDACLK